MKHQPHCVQLSKRFVRMHLEIGVVDEIQDTADCKNDLWIGHPRNYTKKNFFHVFVLRSRLLACERDPFCEVAKTWMQRHCLKPFVHLFFASWHCLLCPTDDVITEQSTM